MSPESAHRVAFYSIRVLFWLPFSKAIFRKLYDVRDDRLRRNLFGLRFENPVGLAAGFDKDGKLFNQLGQMGFGFIEVGTVTPVPQPGNPKPRLFRLPLDRALINRMGFNNEGVHNLKRRLRSRNVNLIIGGNIGKNKVTPNDQAISDYLKSFDELFDLVDYFAINVSSPNTPNLRELQDKKPLEELLRALVRRNNEKPVQKPLLLKISPDLSQSQLEDVIEIIQELGIDGVIATNTTIDRSELITNTDIINQIGPGGLSGRPLASKSTEIIRFIHNKSEGKIPIIGVGGIDSPTAALEKLEAGASLIQIYTGFIYEGPSMVKEINKAILNSSISHG